MHTIIAKVNTHFNALMSDDSVHLESEQRQCSDCEAYLSDFCDPVIFVRNAHGQDQHFCIECSGDVIGPAVDAIFGIFELAPEIPDCDDLSHHGWPEGEGSVVCMYQDQHKAAAE